MDSRLKHAGIMGGYTGMTGEICGNDGGDMRE